jgi:HSP20 family protein
MALSPFVNVLNDPFFNDDFPRSSILVRSKSPHHLTDHLVKDFIDSWDLTRMPKHNNLALDVKESETHYDVYIDAPGVEKDATKIEIKDHVLTISTERKAVDVTETEKFKRVERFSGSSSRSLRLGEDVDEENVEASFTNGVLQVKLPKKKANDDSKRVKMISIQ